LRYGAQPAVYQPGDGARAIGTKGGHAAPSYIDIPGSTVTTWSANATIRMFNAPAPAEVQFAMSAPKVMEMLKEYVVSEGVNEAPPRAELARQAGRRFGLAGGAGAPQAPSAGEKRSTASVMIASMPIVPRRCTSAGSFTV